MKEAENLYELSMINLLNLIGEDFQKKFSLQDIPISVFEEMFQLARRISEGSDAIDYEYWINKALANHPGYQAQQKNKDIMDANVRTALSDFLPKVNLSYLYGWRQNDTIQLDQWQNWTIGLSVDMPIFTSFRSYSQLQEARAVRRQTEEETVRYERNLAVQVIDAFLKIRTTLAQIRITEKGLEQAKKNYQTISQKYDLGMVSNIDFIDARISDTQAGLNYLNAKYDLLIALAYLERLVGEIEEPLYN